MKAKNLKPMIISALLAVGFGATTVGTSFALFTDHAETSISVTAGKIDLNYTISNFKMYSAKADAEGTLEDENGAKYVYEDRTTAASFANGGTATFNGTTVTLDKVTPGDKVTFDIDMADKSNVGYKYRFSFIGSGTSDVNNNSYMTLLKDVKTVVDFYDANDVLLETKDFSKKLSYIAPWTSSKTAAPFAKMSVTMYMPLTVGNEAQDLKAQIALNVEAVQANAITEDADNDEFCLVTNVADLITNAAIPNKTIYVDFDDEVNYLGAQAGDGITLTFADGVNVIGVVKRDGSIKQNLKVLGHKSANEFHNRIEATGKDAKLSNMSISGGMAVGNGFGRYPGSGIYVNGNKFTIDNCKFDGAGNSFKFVNGSMGDLIVKNSTIENYRNFTYAYLADPVPGYWTSFIDGGKFTVDNCSVHNNGTYVLNAEGNGQYLIKDSDFSIGWSSYGDQATAQFINCSIRGDSASYNRSRAYHKVEYVNCSIDGNINFDFGENVSTGIHSFSGCTYGDATLTKELILNDSKFLDKSDARWGQGKYIVEAEEFEKPAPTSGD